MKKPTVFLPIPYVVCQPLLGSITVSESLSPTSVPEPSTWALILIGFAGLSFAGYRRSDVKRRLQPQPFKS